MHTWQGVRNAFTTSCVVSALCGACLVAREALVSKLPQQTRSAACGPHP
jgi:hypothetical protein